MSDQTPQSAPAPLPLPDNPDLDWLRKQAKRRLAELREANADAQLTDAQFELARQYGFSSWRALKAHVDSLTVNGQLVDAARNGDVNVLSALLDQHPEGLHVRLHGFSLCLSGRPGCVTIAPRAAGAADCPRKGFNPPSTVRL